MCYFNIHDGPFTVGSAHYVIPACSFHACSKSGISTAPLKFFGIGANMTRSGLEPLETAPDLGGQGRSMGVVGTSWRLHHTLTGLWAAEALLRSVQSRARSLASQASQASQVSQASRASRSSK